MFIFIPLILIVASFAGIAFVVWKKVPYLKKLDTETVSNGSLLTDFFPEFVDGFRSLKFEEYKSLWFVELEKFLRKLRVISLKMERTADSMIKKVRKGNSLGVVTGNKTVVVEVEKKDVSRPKITQEFSLEDMKKEEQRFIIEIAKNPKDFKLYEVLGDLYVKMTNYSDAKESYDAAIELSPHNENLVKKRSQVLEKLLISD